MNKRRITDLIDAFENDPDMVHWPEYATHENGDSFRKCPECGVDFASFGNRTECFVCTDDVDEMTKIVIADAIIAPDIAQNS